MGDVHIGLSGWQYPRWRGVFYPRGLVHKRELQYAASKFSTIEVNGTFYSLKRPADFERWRNATPDSFLFSLKGARYITHMRRLLNIDAALANFFAQGVFALEDKLGPILWQFPESMRFEPERFESFLKKLPRTWAAAAKLATQHDARLEGRTLLKPRTRGRIRHCVEVRNASFDAPAFKDMLRAHDVALVVSDSPSHWPLFTDVTADFVYMRMHGDKELYTSGYTRPALKRWAAYIAKCRKKADVYVYFDNDAKVFAPRDAETLRAMVLDAA